MAIEWAASAVLPIRPIRKTARVEDRHLEDERRGDRQPERPELAEARPVGPPEAAEDDGSGGTCGRRDDDRDQHAEHDGGGERRRDAGADKLQAREAELAEDQAPGGEGVGDEADRARPEAPERPLHRGDEVAHARCSRGTAGRPIAASRCSARRAAGDVGLLAEREQDRLGEPQDRPDRHRDRDGAPQALPHRAAHLAHRVAAARRARAPPSARRRRRRRCRR